MIDSSNKLTPYYEEVKKTVAEYQEKGFRVNEQLLAEMEMLKRELAQETKLNNLSTN